MLEATAAQIATAVREGRASAVEVTRAHLDRIHALAPSLGAFERVRAEAALREAAAVDEHPDRARLPLAGVPVAIKDNVPVAGEPMREGSAASSDRAQPEDHELVRRLRTAGAVVVGLTRLPELAAWPISDNVFGIARNPWDPTRTPGGSSGGSAAAVAAGMVPIAHGNDGGGSIRIPAACCGVIGLKPGSGVVPGVEARSWFGMSENGPIASTVTDAALMLSVLANDPALRDPEPPARPLRIAVSVRPTAPMIKLDRAWVDAARATAGLLAGAGHHVEEADPPGSMAHANQITLRWLAAVAQDAGGFDLSRLEPRNRRMARIGRRARRLLRDGMPEAYREQLARFFDGFDVLITPTLARIPPEARAWHRRGWLACTLAAARFAPMTFPWNYAGVPAAAVPAGRHPTGLPLSVQLVAPRGGEALILSVARQIEQLAPWPRRAGEQAGPGES